MTEVSYNLYFIYSCFNIFNNLIIYYYFNHLLFIPLFRDEKDSYPKIMGIAEHMAPNTGQKRSPGVYKSHIFTAYGRRAWHAMQGYREVAFAFCLVRNQLAIFVWVYFRLFGSINLCAYSSTNNIFS